MVIDAMFGKGMFVSRIFHLRERFGIHFCKFPYYGDRYRIPNVLGPEGHWQIWPEKEAK